VNDGKFTVVDRRDLDIIRQEINFQLSGEVSDATVAGIGKKIGAQSIIVGSMERAGSLYPLSIRAIEVETAKIQALWSNPVEQDALLTVLTGRGGGSNVQGKSINRVLREATEYLIDRVPAKSKIAVFIKAEDKTLSNYINDGISEGLVNSGKFTVVDRHNLALLQAELDFQYSGEVNEASAVSVGKRIGVESIITGSVEDFGGLYRLQIRSLKVETAAIQAMQHYLIRDTIFLGRLTGKEYKKLYLGAMPGLSIHLFTEGSGNFSIDGAFRAEYFINEIFSLQTGILYTTDTMTIERQTTVEEFASKSLVIPLLAGINFYPSIFVLGVYGGLYMDIPAGGLRYRDNYTRTDVNTARNVLFGYAAGGNAGIKLGSGIVFLDVRYMGNFTNAKAAIHTNSVEIYKRNIIAFGIGYKIGFINQKR
jgi:TolB-like protein